MKVAKFILLLGLTIDCQPGQTLEEQLVGEWKMDKVIEYGEDVTPKHNPNGNRWIRFDLDGTFVSDGDPFGRNTGRWSIDEEKQILHIDSDVDDDDSDWQISFEGEQTIWTGVGHPRKENTQLIHIRVKE